MGTEIMYMESPVGTLRLCSEDGAVVSITKSEERWEDKVETDVLPDCVKQLSEYFAGERRAFNVRLETKGTEFQKAVWRILLTIPFGEYKTYKEIAEMVGNGKGYRAVGNAVGKNPVLIIIPCHRVLAGGGGLGGFSAGINMKEELLELEGIRKR